MCVYMLLQVFNKILVLQIKIKLPVKLLPTHHLLFTFFHISCDVQRGKSNKSSMKQSPLETPSKHMCCSGLS